MKRGLTHLRHLPTQLLTFLRQLDPKLTLIGRIATTPNIARCLQALQHPSHWLTRWVLLLV